MSSPRFSSGMVGLAKRQRAWKTSHTRKARPGGERETNFSLSPLRLAFLAWGDFHARLRFACSTIPEEKWGLLVVYCMNEVSKIQLVEVL